MLMNQILDSSNPDEHACGLKRSASLASLPTPPRTQHKRSRSRACSAVSHHDSDGSASELDDDLGRYAKRVKRVKTTRNSKSVADDDELSEDEGPSHKKRRTLSVLPGHDEDNDDENAFWTGRGGPSREEKQEKEQADTTEQSSPPPAMLSYRVKAPVSPPPSRRQSSTQLARASSVERDVPATPPRRPLRLSPVADAFKTPRKYQATKIWPKRDSPNNPFLVESSEKIELRSEWDSSDDEEAVGDAWVQEGTPTPSYEEKPTITYVFRGQKATFHNPLYGLAPDVIAASKLPIDHPDYEAAEACPPRRLFISAGKQKSRDRSHEGASTQDAERVQAQQSEDEHNQTSEPEQCGAGTASVNEKDSLPNSAETETVSPKAACETSDAEEAHSTREEREHRQTAAKNRLAPRDGLRAGAVFADRDEPARRALGPPRST